tara:strand:- start:64512 stop:65213 length:702 start_codon:yes stop_codon:yes gene_type:complete
MKYILSLFVVIALSPSAFSQDSCRDLKDDVRTFCDGLVTQCTQIKNCMVRRDSCVDSVPTSKSDCDEINSCVNKLDYEFDEYEHCEYRWSVNDEDNSGKCFVRSKWFATKEACPGRIKGLLNAATVGLDATVDGDFDCDAVNKTYVKDEKYCTDALSKFKGKCLIGDEDKVFAKKYSSYSCVYHEKFNKYKKDHFKVHSFSEASSRFNNSNTRSSKGTKNTRNEEIGTGVYSK